MSFSPGMVSTEFQSRLKIFGELKENFLGVRDVSYRGRTKISCGGGK